MPFILSSCTSIDSFFIFFVILIPFSFGRGVYFGDCVSKSLGYAENSGGNPNTDNHMVLFLAEVFVGKMDTNGHRPRPGYVKTTKDKITKI